MAKIKLMLADHQKLVREGLTALLEKEPDIKIMAEAGDWPQSMERIKSTKPDVLLLDLSMPGLSGRDGLLQIKKLSENTRVVILTMHQNRTYIRETLHAGAVGYLLKTSLYEEILAAVRAAAEHKYFLSSEINADIIDNYLHRETTEPFGSKYDLLTKREKQVFRLMAGGNTTNDIAMMLSVSPKTVAKHRTNLMEKLEMKNMATLVRYAMQTGIVDTEDGAWEGL